MHDIHQFVGLFHQYEYRRLLLQEEQLQLRLMCVRDHLLPFLEHVEPGVPQTQIFIVQRLPDP